MVTDAQPKMNKDALFKKMYEENYERVVKYCYFFITNKADIEDFTSEAFLKAYDHLDSFKGDKYLPWLCRIARNLIYDRFRKYENRNVINQFDYEEYYEDPNTNVEETVIKDDEYKEIMKLMDLLSNDQREAVVLRYVQQLEYSEIAEIMNKSENAVRLNISKALKNLKTYARK